MSNAQQSADILPKEAFQGEARIGAETYPISFVAWAGPDARLKFEPVSVPVELYFALSKLLGEPGEEWEEFEISATANSGNSFKSERVYVRGHSSSDQNFEVRLAAAEARVSIKLKSLVAEPVLRRWWRGFQAFGPLQSATPLGTVAVFGEAKAVAHDEVSGGIQISGENASVSATWRDEASCFLLHMQRGLSLAHGGRLDCPLEIYAFGDLQEATFRDAGSAKPELAVQPHLALEPFVKALAARYFAKGSVPDILWTALGWSHAETTIDELRFLTGMIALEAIASACLPSKAKSFAQNIEALFGNFVVTTVDFGPLVVKSMVSLRNEIVHEGEAGSSADLWKSIILVRELITRILLAEIGYVGHYWCYIGGRKLRHFPKCVAPYSPPDLPGGD